ncbi:MAG: GldG family protein [Gammaproteobacteria bacterium]|nr:GldG family protein [Gammaproteobacteria bacterium]
MKVTTRSRRKVLLQNVLFVMLFLSVVGMLAWISTRYHYQADWTATGRNTLSPASVALLAQLQEPVKITAFARDAGMTKKQISDVIGRYQRYKQNLSLEFVNPDTEPERVRAEGITVDGELLLHYQGRQSKLSDLSEQSITNALQGLSRTGERWLVFLEGHGERSPFGAANHDLKAWADEVQRKGFKLKALNLANDPVIPDNTSVLVIAGPQVDYLPGEVKLIEQYLRRGGNLLWLADPGPMFGLKSIAEQLGIEFVPGVVVDPTTQLFKIDDPTFAIVGDYGRHAITQDFNVVTIFPRAAGLNFEAQDDWKGEPFLVTSARSWSETGKLQGQISFDEGVDVGGPLNIGIAAVRDRKFTATPSAKTSTDAAGEQRAVVIGDGDFLANAYLGNGGNLNMGMNMVNWLSRDDQLIAIPAKTALDTALSLSQTQMVLIGFGFLLLLPLLLLGSGLGIWLRRRKA